MVTIFLVFKLAALLEANIISTISGEDFAVARKCMNEVHPCIPESHDCSSALNYLSSSLVDTINELLSVVDESSVNKPGTHSVFRGVDSGTLRLRSSSYHGDYALPETARFYYRLPNSETGWYTQRTTDQYIQFSSPIPYYFSKIITKGRENINSWVKTYKLKYSVDNINWVNYNNEEILQGNTNSDQPNENVLIPFLARSLRLYHVTWNNEISIRAEIYIFKPVYNNILPPGTLIKTVEGGFNIVVSSIFNVFSGTDKIHINSLGSQTPYSWCAAANDDNQWVMINAARLVSWSKIEVQGRGDDDVWVTSVKIKYSVDGLNWIDYNSGEILTANYDRSTIVTIDVVPFTAVSIRIIPVAWQISICLRLEVYCIEV